jgi:hypothetical protein
MKLGFLFGIFHLSLACALAQGNAPPAPGTATRLQQLQTTYQSNLRKLHAPLLADYARELEVLKQTLLTRSRSADAIAVDNELVRVRGLAATTCILPYEMPRKEGPAIADAAAPKAVKPPAAKKAPDGIVLTAAEALPPTEFPLVLRDGPAKALHIGRASWKVTSVPAGTYDLIIFYASAKIPDGQSITAHFSGNDLVLPLTADHSTNTDLNFRAARVGQLTLESEVTNATLTLNTEPFNTPTLWLRSLVLTKSKAKPKP